MRLAPRAVVRARSAAALLLCAVLAAACAPKRLALPQGPGEAFPGYEQAFAEASAACRGVRTFTAEASVSGSVAGQRIRGRLVAGFEAPDRMRLEAVAPLGPPVFILAAGAGGTTLLLPRAEQVLEGAPPEQVLDALVGVSMRPGELSSVLSGCVAPSPVATGGRRFAGGWARVELAGGGAAYLRQEGARWRIRAGERPAFAAEYELPPGGSAVPRAVRITTRAERAPGANLRLVLRQVEVNVPIPAAAFAVVVPRNVSAISLAELRRSGPLGEQAR